MDISWLGHACIRLRASGVFVIMDPTSRESGYDMGRPTADIVTVSHDDANHSNVKGVRGEPLVLDGPGEYEVKGIQLLGVSTGLRPTEEGARPGRNVVFVVEAEELRVVHLGGLGTPLTSEQKEALGTVDVLIVPVGGPPVLEATEAARLVRELEPKVVIPVHYQPAEGFAASPELVKALALEAEPPAQRVTIQKRGLGEKARLVVLEPRS